MTDPWTREDQPFNYNATGYLGKKRLDMLSNHLLQRCRLGRARGAGLGRSPDEVYGITYRNPFTVAHAMTGWAGGTQIPVQERITYPRDKMPADFLQYNMGSTIMGLTTAEEVQAYKNTRRLLPMHQYGPVQEKIVRPPPVQLKPDTVYGIKTTRQEETLTELMTNVYHKQWYMNAKKAADTKATVKPNFMKIRPTYATQLRLIHADTKRTKIPTKSRKLPGTLADVKPHLSTFQSEALRQKVWAAHLKEVEEREGNPVCSVTKSERFPHYRRLPPIEDYHLCPHHGPCVDSSGELPTVQMQRDKCQNKNTVV
ncbi:hypothetical protein BsWGS_23253 [Bradybaena similaris]